TVSHELRTPLAPIKGWATTILDRGDELGPDTCREGVESILRQAQRLERLILNLLDASKIEHGQIDPMNADVDVAGVARRILAEYEAAWPARVFRIPDQHACFS